MHGDFPEDDCQQAEKAQIIDHPISDDERRRFIALDHAVRISGGMNDAKSIVENARAFEAYLKGEPHYAEPTLVA